MKRYIFFFIFIFASISPTALIQAELLTFDDLPYPILPTGYEGVGLLRDYGGLEFTGHYADPLKLYANTGDTVWLNAAVSEPYVVFNPAGTLTISKSEGTFNFISAYFISLQNVLNSDNVTLRGFRDGIMEYNLTVELSNLSPTLIYACFWGIDTLNFTGHTKGGAGGGQVRVSHSLGPWITLDLTPFQSPNLPTCFFLVLAW